MNTGIKKNDILLIFIVLAVAGLAYFLHSVIGAGGAGSVTVKVNGVIEGVYNLGEDQEIVINEGTNYLVIKNGKADMTKADCPDKLCVNQKAVSKKHESIICLPNKVIVEVNSGEKGEYDAVAN
ncbi:NusG domain II-containing protein [Lachnospiraceae bacterium 42-17]|nr:NusG domain II-containing protein [Dorea sp.]